MSAADFAANAIAGRNVTANQDRVIRFHALACFNRNRSEMEMLQGVAKVHGYNSAALNVARNEWAAIGGAA